MLQPVDAICSACKILLTFFFKKWGEGNNLELYHIDDFHLQNNVFLIPLTFWLRICPILKMHGMCVMDIVNKIRSSWKSESFICNWFSHSHFLNTNMPSIEDDMCVIIIIDIKLNFSHMRKMILCFGNMIIMNRILLILKWEWQEWEWEWMTTFLYLY